MKSRIQKWKESTEQRSGFVFCAPQQRPGEFAQSEYARHEDNLILEEKGDHLKKEWEFRIAVYPTKENLNKTVNVLSKVFSNESVTAFWFRV